MVRLWGSVRWGYFPSPANKFLQAFNFNPHLCISTADGLRRGESHLGTSEISSGSKWQCDRGGGLWQQVRPGAAPASVAGGRRWVWTPLPIKPPRVLGCR